MSATEIVEQTFGRQMDEREMRALVFLIARARKETRFTRVDEMSMEQCMQWIEEHIDQARERVEKIVAVGEDGKVYGNSDTVCSFVEYATVRGV